MNSGIFIFHPRIRHQISTNSLRAWPSNYKTFPWPPPGRDAWIAGELRSTGSRRPEPEVRRARRAARGAAEAVKRATPIPAGRAAQATTREGPRGHTLRRGGSNWRVCAFGAPGHLGRRVSEGVSGPGRPASITRCHLNLRKIALEGANVIYKRDVGKVLMKLRKPRITATIWSSGKIICTGATSEEEAKFGARRLARSLQKLGFQVIFTDFKVVNVLAVCNMPFEIRLPEFTKNNRPHASYEPELHPAVCYRIKSLRATLQIFSTGSITVTGPNVKAVATAVEQIYPFVFESRKEIL
ncbi:TATA box-binding protein-like 1 isoform X2 [Oryctolagus cuniculus]|uniref:TATA box-binding protein-like 1 isoform X2 n=1 Tax=Oryctolagus cuniculus TaxID=9986 RepID=UPI003879A9BC